jgi:hypothetical protein
MHNTPNFMKSGSCEGVKESRAKLDIKEAAKAVVGEAEEKKADVVAAVKLVAAEAGATGAPSGPAVADMRKKLTEFEESVTKMSGLQAMCEKKLGECGDLRDYDMKHLKIAQEGWDIAAADLVKSQQTLKNCTDNSAALLQELTNYKREWANVQTRYKSIIVTILDRITARTNILLDPQELEVYKMAKYSGHGHKKSRKHSRSRSRSKSPKKSHKSKSRSRSRSKSPRRSKKTGKFLKNPRAYSPSPIRKPKATKKRSAATGKTKKSKKPAKRIRRV